jgi:hypothetical protein
MQIRGSFQNTVHYFVALRVTHLRVPIFVPYSVQSCVPCGLPPTGRRHNQPHVEKQHGTVADCQSTRDSGWLSVNTGQWLTASQHILLQSKKLTSIYLWLDWLCRWGETSQNRGHQWVYCSSPRWYMSMESHGDDDDAGWGKLLTHPPELSGNPTSSHLGASRRNGQRSEKFAYSVSGILMGSLTCCKILRYGAFPSKGRCATDFYCP